jgi:hypothetical protein
MTKFKVKPWSVCVPIEADFYGHQDPPGYRIIQRLAFGS